MLVGPGQRRMITADDIDSIHNYYEQLVLDQISKTSDQANNDAEFMADVACVALNRLPPRYIRHNVDMTFFMSPAELQETSDKVTAAVKDALEYVNSREVQE